MRVSILLPNIFNHPFTYESKISDALQPGDFVGITFWLASMGMAATTVFLFIERGTIAAEIQKKIDDI